jgi:hypothetical protein
MTYIFKNVFDEMLLFLELSPKFLAVFFTQIPNVFMQKSSILTNH